MYSTVTARQIEVAYTAVAALGFVASLLLLNLAAYDWRAVVRGNLNGYRRRYARKLLREAGERAAVCAALVAIGVIALSIPTREQTLSRLGLSPQLQAAIQQIRDANRNAGIAIASIILGIAVWKTIHACWSLWDEYRQRLQLWWEDRAWRNHHR